MLNLGLFFLILYFSSAFWNSTSESLFLKNKGWKLIPCFLVLKKMRPKAERPQIICLKYREFHPVVYFITENTWYKLYIFHVLFMLPYSLTDCMELSQLCQRQESSQLHNELWSITYFTPNLIYQPILLQLLKSAFSIMFITQEHFNQTWLSDVTSETSGKSLTTSNAVQREKNPKTTTTKCGAIVHHFHDKWGKKEQRRCSNKWFSICQPMT